ncbi:MAG: hypothetical protein QG639_772, partial [Patescibacteria group bacterium]|nr:hypothetical protein [Patescibacteria group bacterium]
MKPERTAPINGPEREIAIKFDGFLADRLVWDLEKLRQLLDLFEVRSNLLITDTSRIQETAQNFSENEGSVLFMTDFNKSLNFSDKKKRIAVNMQYWEELVCKIDSTQLYVDALNTELQRKDKETNFDPESRYVELLNKSLIEIVYQVAIRELQIRYTIAVMYSLFVGILGVVPAFASIVSTYVFVDNFNEVAQQYQSYFQGSSPQTQL